MKKNSKNRYHYIAALSVILTVFSGLGSVQTLPAGQSGSEVSIGIPAKTYYAIVVDDNNNKWFLTELGIISFSNGKWTLHNENSKIGTSNLKDIAYRNNPGGPELWVASSNGATVTTLPFDAKSQATSYVAENAALMSNNVVKVVFGKGPLRWFGTDKGIAALSGDKWLTLSYDDTYPPAMFQEFPITSMATNPAGDSLYVGTDGAGVARVYRNDVDGISGASVYAQWGPIIIPSDKVYSIYIAPDGTKWFGTDQGVATHKGDNTLENWTVFTTEEGLANNFVQAITADKKGNLWFGTKGGGISVYDGSKWTSYTTGNGLNSDNILCLASDNDGAIWIGTDNGVNCYNGTGFISFK
jgi:ligand-binding sensor domain-containing protein